MPSLQVDARVGDHSVEFSIAVSTFLPVNTISETLLTQKNLIEEIPFYLELNPKLQVNSQLQSEIAYK